MEQDLEIIRNILKDLKFADRFIIILIDHLIEKLNKSKHDRFTPNFLYTHSIFEIGRNNARELAEYFDEYLKTGTYKTKLQKFLDNSPYMK
jgi:predicted amidophosphoribosyltransferase